MVSVLQDTSAPPSQISSRAAVTLSLTPDQTGQLRLQVVIDSAAMTSGHQGDSTSRPSSPTYPQLHELVTTRGRVAADSSANAPGDTSCSTASAPLFPATRLLVIPLPATLAPGTSWQDTTVARTCRGTTLLEEARVTTYRVIGLTKQAGASALQLERSTSIDVRTPMADSTRQLGVDGHGESTGTVYMDQVNGLFAHSHDETTLTLSVRFGRSTVAFRQTGTQDITRQP
jgi:hypothetical protein